MCPWHTARTLWRWSGHCNVLERNSYRLLHSWCCCTFLADKAGGTRGKREMVYVCVSVKRRLSQPTTIPYIEFPYIDGKTRTHTKCSTFTEEHSGRYHSPLPLTKSRGSDLMRSVNEATRVKGCGDTYSARHNHTTITSSIVCNSIPDTMPGPAQQ